MKNSRPRTSSYRPFRPRAVICDGWIRSHGFDLRTYFVTVDDSQTRANAAFAEGVRLALRDLPQKPYPGCPGVGFVIRHLGDGANYVVLSWWTKENELPTRVFYANSSDEKWRRAKEESFCVWDIEIIWAERNHYVNCVLCDHGDVERYIREAPDQFTLRSRATLRSA
jgi:hypothetical protein